MQMGECLKLNSWTPKQEPAACKLQSVMGCLEFHNTWTSWKRHILNPPTVRDMRQTHQFIGSLFTLLQHVDYLDWRTWRLGYQKEELMLRDVGIWEKEAQVEGKDPGWRRHLGNRGISGRWGKDMETNVRGCPVPLASGAWDQKLQAVPQ